MIELDLSSDDVKTLRETLESALGDLRHEISMTDSLDYREALKTKRALLERVIEQLG